MIKSGADTETDRLRRRIEERTNHPLMDLRYYARGQNANLYLIDLDDRRRMMVKTLRSGNDVPADATLEPEGWMLQYLARKTSLPVPKVFWYDNATILMDFIEDSGPITEKAQHHAAELLLGLHAIKNDFFGLERDSAIGPYVQPNNYEVSWINFFRDHRLLYAAQKCLEDGVIDAGLMRRIEKVAAHLGEYIDGDVRPSLIHGDLWGGNIMVGQDRINAFLDPAVYYGDPEIELALIRLFGTFEKPFFDHYFERSPERPGFEEARRHIYALYPLMIHARIYGTPYIEAIYSIVNRFGGAT